MTKIVLCYGVILGLYCLLHGVYGSEDDSSVQHSDAKHNRRRGDGYPESGGIPKDKIFIKSESPLRGRKIHQTAWSQEEATENSPDEFKMAEKTTDSWNFEKLYSYLLSLIPKTGEMKQAEMTPSETVALIRNKIKSEIKARRNTESGKIGSEVPISSESRRLTYETNFERGHFDGRVENSESSEESEEYDESCEEDEDSSSEMYDNRKNKGNIKHKDKEENGSENNEDCYENEESDEKSSVRKETGSTNAKKLETVSAKERKQSTSINTQLPAQEITVLNATSVKDDQKPINILRKTTGAARIGSKPQIADATTPKSENTVKMNKAGNVGSGTHMRITPTTSSYVHESTVVNHLPTNRGLEKSTDQLIRSNTATKSNVHDSLLQKESPNTGTATTTMKGLVTDSKSATQTLPQDNFEVIITAPEFIPISNKEIGNTKVYSNKIMEVKPNMDEMLNVPVEVAHVYGGKQSEGQKVDVSENEVLSQINLQNLMAKETKSETTLGKTSKGDSMVLTQRNYENIENNPFQQESFFNYDRKDDILEEYNLKNEFIELSDNNKNEFMNMLKDYNTNNQKYDVASQHSSMSQNGNEENAGQETFDTILEFLYKHSKNPLILSLKNSNKTLF